MVPKHQPVMMGFAASESQLVGFQLMPSWVCPFFPMEDFTTKYLIPIPRQGSMDWFKGKSTGNIRKP